MPRGEEPFVRAQQAASDPISLRLKSSQGRALTQRQVQCRAGQLHTEQLSGFVLGACLVSPEWPWFGVGGMGHPAHTPGSRFRHFGLCSAVWGVCWGISCALTRPWSDAHTLILWLH